MGCESCGTGTNGMPRGCRNNGTCSSGGCDKLAVYDWLANMELPGNMPPFEYVEIRFKNTRKDFYFNATPYPLNIGDAVVVEGSPGTDLGTVSAAGELARLQMDKMGISTKNPATDTGKKPAKYARELKKVLRKATEADIALWKEARGREKETLSHARTIADSLGLEMKISDIEFQGDNTKVIIYYTARGRVDFRELIKKYSEAFRVRIEMKQIGARQEAGRLGGIGSCGRELCCSTWLRDFRTVSNSAARYQQLALNTQKLAGQCGKLKCCLNYELDAYLDALKHFPKHANSIETKKGRAKHLKTDIFKGVMWYIMADDHHANPVALEVEQVKALLELNKSGTLPESLQEFAVKKKTVEEHEYSNAVGQDSLTRFDKKLKSRRGKGKKSQSDQAKKKKSGKEKEAVKSGASKKPRFKKRKGGTRPDSGGKQGKRPRGKNNPNQTKGG
ncbi:MAG TPA: regulatory iron-sulfur-containing complex subunit RicT [Cryomorphaceae bacterium]|nr:regulatory iron-sulfur-containing complex subunit RicT [Cryomorphaceae bacterium]